MGNGKSKTTKSANGTSSSTIVVDWKNDAYINHLIVAGRLAPKVTDNTENREAECPICFLNFEYLNTVVCCKQAICTGCVVQLKRATATAACPFCTEKTLAVAFSRSRRVSEPGAPPPVYTTPEQDRKLRSMSSDEIHVSPVSKQSREELERQISTQRMMYHDPDEDNRVFAQASVRRPRAVTTSSLRNRNNNNYEFNHSPNSRGGAAGSSSSRMNQRHSNYQSSSSPTRGMAGDAHVLSSLRTILGPSQLDQISSIEELEELMLLEAIRQSQNEASSATTVSTSTLTPVAPSQPSPSHQSPSSSRRNRQASSQQQQQLLSDFRDSHLSHSVSSSGSNHRLDSGSEGNKSNSQLSEMEVSGAVNTGSSSSGSGGESSSSSSSSSSTGSGGVVNVTQGPVIALPGSDLTASTAVSSVGVTGLEEEEELYDEELELALQLSLMSAAAAVQTKPATPPAPVPSSSSIAAVSNAAAEEENSKLSSEALPDRPASASEGISDPFSEFVSAPASKLQQEPPPTKSLEAVQAYNNNWLNAFESELSMGMMVKNAEGQPTSDKNNNANASNVTTSSSSSSSS